MIPQSPVHRGEPRVSDEEYVSEIEQRRNCHTCGQPYPGKECGNVELHHRIDRFRNTDRISATPEAWAAAHAGPCGVCGEPGRLFASGWHYCPTHQPNPVRSRAA